MMPPGGRPPGRKADRPRPPKDPAKDDKARQAWTMKKDDGLSFEKRFKAVFGQRPPIGPKARDAARKKLKRLEDRGEDLASGGKTD